MKLVMDTASLRSAVDWTARHIPARPVPQILGAAVLTAEAEALTIHGFDYDNWAESCVEAQTAVAGQVAVSGRLLRSVADAMPRNGRVDLVADDGTALRISAGNLRASLPLMPVEDYPARPKISEPSLLLPPDTGRVLTSALPVAGDMESHLPDACGCQVTLDASGLEVITTDRYRLFISRLPWPQEATPPTEPVYLPLPVRSVKALADAAKAGGLRLGLPTNDAPTLCAALGGSLLSVRLSAGRMPNYQKQTAPIEPTRSLGVDTADLLAVLKALAPLTESNEAKARLVRVEVGDGLFRVVATDAGTVADAVPCEHTPQWDEQPWELAVNATFLAELLVAADAESVRMDFTGPTKPLHITVPGSDRFRAVMMPIRLPGATR